MNYLAAYINSDKLSWVIADSSSGNVLEHGVREFKLQTEDISNDSINLVEESENINTSFTPDQPYSTAIGYLSLDLADNLYIDLPFSDPKKVEKIIPLQLQDRLPIDLEEIHFAIQHEPIQYEGNYRYSVSYIERKKFEKLLEVFKDLKINFSKLYVETFLLKSLVIALNDSNDDSNELSQKTTIDLSLGYLSNSENESRQELLLSIQDNDKDFHHRKLLLPEQDNFILPYIESQIHISLSSINAKEDITTKLIAFITPYSGKQAIELLKKLPNIHIENLEPIYEDSIQAIWNTKLIFALFSAQTEIFLEEEKQLKELIPNLRQGQFKYRAPLTEIKEACFAQITPLILVLIFGILSLVFSLLIPVKKSKLISDKIYQITSEELESSIRKGSEIQELEASIQTMEDELGSMKGISVISPLDWLYQFSSAIDQNIKFNLQSLSISPDGLSFRGYVPDYPTTGKINSILTKLQEDNPNKFCKINFNDTDSTADKKGIAGEIILCQ